MNFWIQLIVIIVALEHLYILYMEMFAWETLGRKAFKQFPADLFKPTKSLAANQGLYNGFLSAGLVWSVFIKDAVWSHNVALFFLICVAAAGIYGALTAARRIFFVQAIPALAGIALMLLK